MEETPSLPLVDVIAVGAHPDDMEIACGGTIALLAKQGVRVGIVDLTDGEPTPGSPGPDVRLAEAESAAACLGATFRHVLPLPNRRLFDSYESRVALATLFRRCRPRLVIGLVGRTPQASPDHWQAMQITEGAIFYSRLTKWDEQFAGTEPHRIEAQLGATLIGPTVGDIAGMHRVVVDISATVEQKRQAIACYKTQFPAEKRHVFDRVEVGDRSLGLQVGAEAAECLYSPRPLAVRQPMEAIFGGDR